MTHSCTEERFLEDVKNHTMNVIKDDGVYRHIRFAEGNSSFYHFDLITWPGYLAIVGDCGSYVFRRIFDMFEFFESDHVGEGKTLYINPSYWGEKLEAHSGYREYCEAVFKERIESHFKDYWSDDQDLSEEELEFKAETWQAIKADILMYADNEHIAYESVQEFCHENESTNMQFQFEDFFDAGSTEEYTFRYLWCIYAIAYGVNAYNDAKIESSNESSNNG